MKTTAPTLVSSHRPRAVTTKKSSRLATPFPTLIKRRSFRRSSRSYDRRHCHHRPWSRPQQRTSSSAFEWSSKPEARQGTQQRYVTAANTFQRLSRRPKLRRRKQFDFPSRRQLHIRAQASLRPTNVARLGICTIRWSENAELTCAKILTNSNRSSPNWPTARRRRSWTFWTSPHNIVICSQTSSPDWPLIALQSWPKTFGSKSVSRPFWKNENVLLWPLRWYIARQWISLLFLEKKIYPLFWTRSN